MIELIKKIVFRNKDSEEIYCIHNTKKYFFKINWLKTIWFNYKALPLKQAHKIPFIIGYNCKIKKIGKIKLGDKVYLGMVSIGVIRIDTLETNANKTIFYNGGKITFQGRTKFHPGSKLCVNSNAIISFGKRNSFGCNTKIVSQCAICIGNDFRISWDSQIFDTDFHFLKKVTTGKTYTRKKSVIIGDNVFIGNSSTIGKGTKIPSGCVISCCSKVTGDYSIDGENLLIAGNPAKVLAKGFVMGNSWFPEQECKDADSLNERKMVQQIQKDLNL